MKLQSVGRAACACVGMIFLSGCFSVDLHIKDLPEEIDQLLVASESLFTKDLLQQGFLPDGYVFIITYDVCRQTPDGRVSAEWGKIFSGLFNELVRTNENELDAIGQRINEYLERIESLDESGVAQLGAFSSALKAENTEMIRKQMNTLSNPEEGGYFWKEQPDLFGKLIAGFQESLYGIGVSSSTHPSPMTLRARFQGPMTRIMSLRGYYRDVARFRHAADSEGEEAAEEEGAVEEQEGGQERERQLELQTVRPETLSREELASAWNEWNSLARATKSLVMEEFAFDVPQPVERLTASIIAGEQFQIPLKQSFVIREEASGPGDRPYESDFQMHTRLMWDGQGEVMWESDLCSGKDVRIARIWACRGPDRRFLTLFGL